MKRATADDRDNDSWVQSKDGTWHCITDSTSADFTTLELVDKYGPVTFQGRDK